MPKKLFLHDPDVECDMPTLMENPQKVHLEKTRSRQRRLKKDFQKPILPSLREMQ